MLVRRQNRDLEIGAEVARSGAGTSQGARGAGPVAPVSVAPVSVAMEKSGEPMDAQARMLDDDNSFELRWRARAIAE